MAIKTEYKIAALWVGFVLLQFARIMQLEIPYSIEIVAGFLILIWTIYYLQNSFEYERAQLSQKQEYEILREENTYLANTLEEEKNKRQFLLEQLAISYNQKTSLIDTISTLSQDQRKAQSQIESLAEKKGKVEHELHEQKNRFQQLRKIFIQYIPKSKTGAPFGLPIKKKSEWLKWQKTYSIIVPLRKQDFNWEQIKAKIIAMDKNLPADRSTLRDIERAGSFGLLDHWPPDISLFVNDIP